MIEKLEMLWQSEEEQVVLVEAMDREEVDIARAQRGIGKKCFWKGWASHYLTNRRLMDMDKFSGSRSGSPATT